jgi:hypothetical protein
MRIRMTCWTCLTPVFDLILGARHRGEGGSEEEERAALKAAHKEVDIVVTEERVIRATCAAGHALAWVIFNPRHELLFERGALAMVDGYYREAVANFAAALERFYEFHTRVVVWKNGIAVSDADAAWKSVAAQSERQLGAFLFTALTYYRSPVDMKGIVKHVEFRNSVIHKGAFPSYEQSLEFGEAVRVFICRYLKALEDSGASPFSYQQDVITQPICREHGAMSHGCATLITLGHLRNADFGQRTLAEGLVAVRRYRRSFYPREPE